MTTLVMMSGRLTATTRDCQVWWWVVGGGWRVVVMLQVGVGWVDVSDYRCCVRAADATPGDEG